MQRTFSKKDIVKVLSRDGETHFVLRDCAYDGKAAECFRLKVADVRAVLKREASKPLLLLRAE